MSLDRTGEPVEDSKPWHDPRCRGGWLGFDADYRPIPCLTCKDHLLSKERRFRTMTTNDCADRLPSAYVAANLPESEPEET